MAAWTGCIAGALTETEFRRALAAAGLEEIEIRETHRVHEHAAAAIIRARKPAGRRLMAPTVELHPPQTLYRHWEHEQWNPWSIDLAVDDAPMAERAHRPGQGPRLLGALLADGRRGANHDQVRRPRDGRRQRGGGELPRDPAGRRSPAHAVLRPLPGRGDRPPRRRSPHTSRARASSSATRSRSSSTRRSSPPTTGSRPTRATRSPKSTSSRPTTSSSRALLGLTAFEFITRYLRDNDLLPGFVDGYSHIHHDEQRHIGYGVWYLHEAAA